MRQFLKNLLKYSRCALGNHIVSEQDEEELFSDPHGYLRTTCSRCEYPLLLRLDPADEEKNYYMLMEE